MPFTRLPGGQPTWTPESRPAGRPDGHPGRSRSRADAVPLLPRTSAGTPTNVGEDRRLLVDRMDVDWPVEHDYKQAGRALGRSVPHRLARRKVAVGARSDNLAVDLELASKDDYGGGRRVSVPLCPETGRVSDQVVDSAGIGISIQHSQGDVAVVDDRLIRLELDRHESIDDDRASVFHHASDKPSVRQ